VSTLMVFLFRWLVFSVFLGTLAGCLALGRPVVAERSPVFRAPAASGTSSGAARVYAVRAGDTLYSIAWRFELDYEGLARANGISAPYVIRPGQKMRLVTQLPVAQRAVSKPTAPAPKAPRRAQEKASPLASSKADAAIDTWKWPMPGKPLVEFRKSGKGMDFGLERGATAKVVAASGGEVVYAANGIGGFERLVIIKHTSALLSAYGFNGRLRVKEGQRVGSGARIADINARHPAQTALHFELRKNGQPVEPRQYLP